MRLPRPRLRLSTLLVMLTVSAGLIYANTRPHSPQTLGFYMPADEEPGPDWSVFGNLYGWPWAYFSNPQPAHHPGAEISFRHIFWDGAAWDAGIALGLLAAASMAWEGFLFAMQQKQAGKSQA
jgi:hypothetical protein